MALDEYLFGKIANYFKKKKTYSSKIIEKTVYLEEIKQRLTIMARALTGTAIEIFPAEREGGFKNTNFFFPTSFSFFETYEQNLSYYFYRLIYLSNQKELKLNWYQATEIDLKTAQQKAHETSDVVLEKMFVEYPVTKQFYHEFETQLKRKSTEKKPIDYTWLFGKWMKDENISSNNQELNQFSDLIKKAQEEQAKTEIKSKAVEDIITIELDKKQQEDYVMTHNFEKVETAEEHSGVWRDFDGEDELEDHQDALDELNMKYVVRVDDTAHSIYHAEFTENTSISESTSINNTDFHYSYPEWNFAKNEYKANYCNVYPLAQATTDTNYYQKTILENATTLQGLRKMLTSVNNKMQQVRRQTDGDEFELDALSDMYVDIHSKRTPNENIYLSKRKKEKDISILLLLDISLSSDGYADGNRVIDVEKKVSILFGEILNEYDIDFAVQGFYSKTRNFSSYVSLKEFDENWSISKHKIGSIEPKGYTRIGAALRHSGFLLSKRQTKNKWVILLSDGKPNDYDKYEGKYGIQDVKQALHELKAQNINSYALAIEAQAKYYLPQMFGQNHYQILTTPVELLKSLVKLYEKIKYA
ncbi:MAG: VWA domain-containing protein [Chitinophagaceae bacterium]|jgi:nitric oxide reductase NorD protein|nr:VWA domain-containing protein [Chitinophagaceae bacterium]